jgi:methylmalonyl-CoA mutase
LQAYGVAHIFSPEDGQRMGLTGMILSIIQACDIDLSQYAPTSLTALTNGEMGSRHRALAQLITALENDKAAPGLKAALHQAARAVTAPTLGITGTGGAGKSSLTDELIRRIRRRSGYRHDLY